MQLRQYQEQLTYDTSYSLKNNRRTCVQLDTGGGKTVIFSTISYRYTKKSNKSVLILVNRKELLQQTRATLFSVYGITAELIIAGTRYIPKAKVYIGMVESTHRRIERLENIGLVIIDECHIAVFNKMHSHFPDQYILGFTATPLSSNKRFPMNLYYENLVCGPGIPFLINEGFLCQNITRAPKDIVDRSALATKNGDFDDEEMSKEFSKPKHVHNVVEVYKKWSLGKKTIIFNVNVAHSEEVVAAFLEQGFDCRHLDGEDNSTYRTKTLEWFAKTKNAILCNVGILTTGFDEPTIETVIVNKATMSLTLWLQMTGRGGRVIDEYFINKHQSRYPYRLQLKSYFNIIDMGGNALTHGDWCDERDWKELFFNPPKTNKESVGIAPTKSCPNCEGILPASTRVCRLEKEDGIECGYVFPEKVVGPEEELSDFIVVTKNIDAVSIIEANRDKREYYIFFGIGTHFANEAKKTISVMTDEIANLVLLKYYEQGKIWAKHVSENRMKVYTGEGDKPKKIIFSQWHQQKAKEHLFIELSKHFPEWQNNQLASTTTSERQTTEEAFL